jgi:SUKH-3 immunity protein
MTDFTWPTEVTQRAVERAGWDASRQIDISEWLRELTRQGYSFSELSKTILHSFGGLVIRPAADAPEAVWGSEPIVFDPMEAGDGMYERYKPQELALGHRMSPLASWGGESAVMLLDDGRVVSDSSFGLQLLGNNFPEAVDLAVRRYRKPVLLINYEPHS